VTVIDVYSSASKKFKELTSVLIYIDFLKKSFLIKKIYFDKK